MYGANRTMVFPNGVCSEEVWGKGGGEVVREEGRKESGKGTVIGKRWRNI